MILKSWRLKDDQDLLKYQAVTSLSKFYSSQTEAFSDRHSEGLVFVGLFIYCLVNVPEI